MLLREVHLLRLLLDEVIALLLQRGEQVLLVSHSNVIRELVKYLDGLEEEVMTALYMATGVPIVYEFEEENQTRKRYFHRR